MKQLIRFVCLAALIYLQSCGGKMIKNDAADSTQKPQAHVSRTKTPVPRATDNLVIKDEKDIVGYWVGFFYSAFEGKVNISIDAINGRNVSGHTLIAGIVKPFVSEMEKDGVTYNFFAQRSGSGKYDGKFKISIAEGDSVLHCTWMPDGNAKTHESIHGFSKKLFRYDPNSKLDNGRFVDYHKEKTVKYHDEADGDVDAAAYVMATSDVNNYNTSADLLTKKEIANMKKPDILVLRNSIFARHGYAFKKEALWVYFSRQDWYIPISADVTTELTPIEKKNIDLLTRYEKNAKEYYDTFGR